MFSLIGVNLIINIIRIQVIPLVPYDKFFIVFFVQQIENDQEISIHIIYRCFSALNINLAAS